MQTSSLLPPTPPSKPQTTQHPSSTPPPADKHTTPRIMSSCTASPPAFALNPVLFFPHTTPRPLNHHANTPRTAKLFRRPPRSPHVLSASTMSTDSPQPNIPSPNITKPAPVAGNGAPTGHQLEDDDDFRDEYDGFLDDATVVSVPLPLDLYLSQSNSGKVYVDEIVPDGNADKVGGISVGDILIAVSIPFGETLIPVPDSNALDMVEQHISSRETGEDFHMALIPGDIQLLSAEEPEDGLDTLTLEEMESNAKKIYVKEYPYVEEPEPIEEQQLDLEALKEQGFDI